MSEPMPFTSMLSLVTAFCLDPPYCAVADRARFPPNEVTLAWHTFNAARIAYLEARIADPLDSMRPCVKAELVDQLNDAKRTQHVLCYITRFSYEPPESEEYWRLWMPRARAIMGEEWYQRAWVPWGGWAN